MEDWHKRQNIPVKNHYFVKTRDAVKLTKLVDSLVEAAQAAHVDVYEFEKKDRPHLAFTITQGAERHEIEDLYAHWASTGEE